MGTLRLFFVSVVTGVGTRVLFQGSFVSLQESEQGYLLRLLFGSVTTEFGTRVLVKGVVCFSTGVGTRAQDPALNENCQTRTKYRPVQTERYRHCDL